MLQPHWPTAGHWSTGSQRSASRHLSLPPVSSTCGDARGAFKSAYQDLLTRVTAGRRVAARPRTLRALRCRGPSPEVGAATRLPTRWASSGSRPRSCRTKGDRDSSPPERTLAIDHESHDSRASESAECTRRSWRGQISRPPSRAGDRWPLPRIRRRRGGARRTRPRCLHLFDSALDRLHPGPIGVGAGSGRHRAKGSYAPNHLSHRPAHRLGRHVEAVAHALKVPVHLVLAAHQLGGHRQCGCEGVCFLLGGWARWTLVCGDLLGIEDVVAVGFERDRPERDGPDYRRRRKRRWPRPG